MPRPPSESIGGKKMYQEDAFEFSKVAYDYVTKQESFVETEEFQELDDQEKYLIVDELRFLNLAYERLWDRVDKY